jgi:hypothetical protein
MSNSNRIKEFVNSVKEDREFGHIYARVSYNDDLITREGVTQIRSKKHNIQAMAWDDLGNMTALYPNGAIRQYITKKEIRDAGITGI